MKTWATRKLGDIARIRRGASPRPKGDPRYFGGNIPWLKIGDVPPGSRFVSQTEEGVTAAGRELSVYVEPGTLLLSNSASVGRPVITKVGACIHDGWLAIDGYESALRQDFLYWCLIWSQSRFQRLAPSGTQKNLNIGLAVSFEVAVPPMAEQERIVKLLDEADELRNLRAQADSRTAKLIPALFNEMFGDPNVNPKGWPVVSLGELVKFVGGGTPSRSRLDFFEGDIPWATSKDVKTEYMSDTQEHITEEAVEKSTTNLVPARTVLVVVKSKILMHSLPVAITTVPMCFGQDLKGLLCGDRALPEFVASSLRIQKDGILAQARGANTEGLTLEILRAVKIPLPLLPLQKEFAAQVSEIREMEAAQAASRQRLEALFQSMLHRAFNGELI